MFTVRDNRTGELMQLHCSPNGPEADFCNDTTCGLRHYGGGLYVSKTREEAQAIIDVGTPWYNSSHEHPQVSKEDRPFLEVVELVVK